MKVIVATLLVCTFLISGCGYKEGVMTADQTSYLYFMGESKDMFVSIDGGEKFKVNSGHKHQYKVSPGTRHIQVYDKNSIVVDRQIFLSDGVAKGIQVN